MSGIELIAEASKLSKWAHMGQTDKAGEDYFLHPQTVASFVDTPEEKAVAYLHDVIEDTSITLSDLRSKGFDENVIEAIDAITKREGEEYDAYLSRVIENPVATKVKLADMKHNGDIGRFKKQNEYAKKITNKYKQKRKELLKLSANRT